MCWSTKSSKIGQMKSLHTTYSKLLQNMNRIVGFFVLPRLTNDCYMKCARFYNERVDGWWLYQRTILPTLWVQVCNIMRYQRFVQPYRLTPGEGVYLGLAHASFRLGLHRILPRRNLGLIPCISVKALRSDVLLQSNLVYNLRKTLQIFWQISFGHVNTTSDRKL